jgi:integrase
LVHVAASFFYSWAEPLVALATFVLALVTLTNVIQTRRLIKAEDIRHQERLAPIVEFRAATKQMTVPGAGPTSMVLGIILFNRGLGPALNVDLKVDYVYTGALAHLSGQYAVKINNPIANQANLGRDVHIHTLRHTYASLALKGGVPVTTVSSNLGHSGTATTLNVYAHHIPSAEDAAAIVLERAIVGVS